MVRLIKLNKNMSKKIIQLSTKQCPPCQQLKQDIEKIIDKTSYTYEYVSMYNGPDMEDANFNFTEYWNQIDKVISLYKKEVEFIPRQLPIVLIKEDDIIKLSNKTEILNILRNEGK
jgi:esterase/lipase